MNTTQNIPGTEKPFFGPAKKAQPAKKARPAKKAQPAKVFPTENQAVFSYVKISEIQHWLKRNGKLLIEFPTKDTLEKYCAKNSIKFTVIN